MGWRTIDVNNDQWSFRDAAETMAEQLCENCENRPEEWPCVEIYDVPCGEWYTCGNSFECVNYKYRGNG